MECKVKNDIGTIYITEDVMLKVAGYAALECYGIVAMSGQRATDGIVEWLGRENLTKGVQIRLFPESIRLLMEPPADKKQVSSLQAMLPVWELAAFAPAAVRPDFTMITGLVIRDITLSKR